MSQPRISVVIPTYNRAAMVANAVQSALAQSRPADEIIVVDDGSRDRTPEVLFQFGDRIRWVRQENQGVSAARNHGIRLATGDWIAFLDSDDCWHTEKLAVQTAYLARHPEVDLLACNMRHVDGYGPTTEPLNTTEHVAERLTLAQLVLRACFQTSGVIVRRRCLEAAGPFDTTLKSAEDRDLWIRIGATGDVRRLETVLAYGHGEEHEHLSGKPEITEVSSRRMLEKVFRDLPALRGHPLLKRHALSVVAHEAGINYTEHGNQQAALRLLVRSMVLWPVPRGAHRHSRLRTLAVGGLRYAGLRKN
jgi:hypothetical protein